ncbi:MAG: S8 family serine peptidase [Bacteroidia bacterium]|nr:S8 family serine peptidase [Bacteroidia bacterium]
MKKISLACLLFVLSFITNSMAQEKNIKEGHIIALLPLGINPLAICSDLEVVNGIPSKLEVGEVLSSSMNIVLFYFDYTLLTNTQMLKAFRTHPDIRIAQNNHIVEERIIPNDAQFGVMWDMHNTGQSGGVVDADIDAPEAWDITTGGLTAQGDTIVVAVIDGGFDLSHPDLNFWKNYDEIPNNGIDDDNNGYIDDFDGWYTVNNTDNLPNQSHGTHVAGTVGAKGNNGIGVTGVNWNVKVMPISYGSTGGLESNVVEAYAFARDQRREYNTSNGTKGAFVVSTNSSFGIDNGQPSNYPLWCAMYDSLGTVGILSAGATANQNFNIDATGDIPTACESDWLITVTNTTRNDVKTANAGYGLTTIDLGAPGSNITSTYPSNSYSSISGTSMATPHVAGTVAMMLSVSCNQFITDYKANPAAMALVIKDSLLNATDAKASLAGITVTGGRLNLFNAVKSIQNYCLSSNIPENEFNGIVKNVYPNPATNSITLVYECSQANEIVISNVLGQEVIKTKGLTTQGISHQKIDVSNLSKGIYFIRIDSQAKKSNNIKVIID